MQICTSPQRGNHDSIPPLSFLQAGYPSCHPTNSSKHWRQQLLVLDKQTLCWIRCWQTIIHAHAHAHACTHTHTATEINSEPVSYSLSVGNLSMFPCKNISQPVWTYQLDHLLLCYACTMHMTGVKLYKQISKILFSYITTTKSGRPTRRNIHPFTPILIINHPLSVSSIYYNP